MKNRFIIIGDTHGNHRVIMHRIKALKITGMILLHVGDFGVGFAKTPQLEDESLRQLNNVLAEHDCHLYVIRGNHDDPKFFNGDYNFSNLHLLPDYSVVEVNGDKVLMVGGAISVDRGPRLSEMRVYAEMGLLRETYWRDEAFNLDEDKLTGLTDIKYVITHSSPNFVFPINDTNNHVNSHGGLVEHFVKLGDDKLKDDLNLERTNITRMHDILSENNQIKGWYYGHFHSSVHDNINGTTYRLLNCDEFFYVFQDNGEEA
jgi:UDP-2,3-diacylglucosamine pyrophosphatase LpxH